ncbi:MAG: ribonuclease H-like domain-containing protein [Patescibacteria group bacterium]|nr:ribonuclease H-like domain-containing protein [Patescibacteria group bacterium]MDD5121493.1 ribonuclease H-like domain-containing protein [Patescibacteria group bacterium]MDD5222189.1 ribonuclease H-like domain-containing protein [Patescibacteria group bacterium]MDD5396345.1 ribonuclease H-like domain-containing protein [Patescibacteria group bacterium]
MAGVKNYDECVSFNGRAFDAPFLMIRSAINNIRPTVNLMPNRYLESQKFGIKHVDLYDQLSFYGAVRKKGSLHLWTRAFGIKSPKDGEINGHEVGKLFQDKKYLDIARYNAGDLVATKELYEIWNKYLRF